MSFALLIVLLVVTNQPVYAEWELLIKSNQGGPDVYFNPDTIRRYGDIVEMLSLNDFKTTRTDMGDTYLSSQIQNRYDCIHERYRILSVTRFLGNMGSGKVVFDKLNQSNEWI